VATHGRLTPDPPYVHSNRGYSTDGDETHSHRAPSERTYSEYTLNHERISPQYNPSRKKRSSSNGHHQHLQSSYSHSQMGLSSSPDNGGPRSLSGPPPTMFYFHNSIFMTQGVFFNSSVVIINILLLNFYEHRTLSHKRLLPLRF